MDRLEAYAHEIPGAYNIRRDCREVKFNVEIPDNDLEEQKRVMDMIRHDISLMSEDVGDSYCNSYGIQNDDN